MSYSGRSYQQTPTLGSLGVDILVRSFSLYCPPNSWNWTLASLPKSLLPLAESA